MAPELSIATQIKRRLLGRLGRLGRLANVPDLQYQEA